jgi:hypothetical protein
MREGFFSDESHRKKTRLSLLMFAGSFCYLVGWFSSSGIRRVQSRVGIKSAIRSKLSETEVGLFYERTAIERFETVGIRIQYQCRKKSQCLECISNLIFELTSCDFFIENSYCLDSVP